MTLEERRAQERGRKVERRREYRRYLLELAGGKCSWCDESDFSVLHVDHCYSDGAVARRNGQRWVAAPTNLSHLEKSLALFKLGKLQVLCVSCNLLKLAVIDRPRWRGITDVSARTRKREQLRLWVIQNAGGRCVQCSQDDARVLQFDHRHSTGYLRGQEKVESLSQATKVLTRFFTGELQLLCGSCNWKKRDTDLLNRLSHKKANHDSQETTKESL